MVECPECGNETETKIILGKFVHGCFSPDHIPPTVCGEYLGNDIWPICGFPKDTEKEAIESYNELSNCFMRNMEE